MRGVYPRVDNSIVFYNLHTSNIWFDKRVCIWWAWLYKREGKSVIQNLCCIFKSWGKKDKHRIWQINDIYKALMTCTINTLFNHSNNFIFFPKKKNVLHSKTKHFCSSLIVYLPVDLRNITSMLFHTSLILFYFI